MTVTSIQDGMKLFIANHKESDLDEEDFNFTADSLMKGKEDCMDDREEESRERRRSSMDGSDNSVNSERDIDQIASDLQENSSCTPSPLAPFSRKLCRTDTMDDSDDVNADQEPDEHNLNDVSMLSDDSDNRPTSPARAFHPPPSRHLKGKRNTSQQPSEDEDLSHDDDDSSKDIYDNNSIYNEDEDESDNSSIDTAGMKHSQTIDSENFFFRPEPEPETETETRTDETETKTLPDGATEQDHDNTTSKEEGMPREESPAQDSMESVQREDDNIIANENTSATETETEIKTETEKENSVVSPGSTAEKEEHDLQETDILASISVLDPDDQDSNPPPEINTEAEAGFHVGLSLTALPRQLRVAPHPIESSKLEISGDIETDTENIKEVKSDIAKERMDFDDVISGVSTINSAATDGTAQSKENSHTDDNFWGDKRSQGAALRPPSLSSSISLPSRSTEDHSEFTLTLPEEQPRDDIAGLWQRHPVRKEMLTKEKEKVYAFGRTSYEAKGFQHIQSPKNTVSHSHAARRPDSSRLNAQAKVSNSNIASNKEAKVSRREDRKESKRTKLWDTGESNKLKVKQFNGDDGAAGKGHHCVSSGGKSAKNIPHPDETPFLSEEDHKRAALLRSDDKGERHWEVARNSDIAINRTESHEVKTVGSIDDMVLFGTENAPQFDTIGEQTDFSEGRSTQQQQLPPPPDNRRSFSGSFKQGGEFVVTRGATSKRLSTTGTVTIGAFKGQHAMEDHVHLLGKRVEV